MRDAYTRKWQQFGEMGQETAGIMEDAWEGVQMSDDSVKKYNTESGLLIRRPNLYTEIGTNCRRVLTRRFL